MKEKYLSLLKEFPSETTNRISSTVVLGFGQGEYNAIAKVYSLKRNYKFSELQSILEIFGYLELSNFKKVIIFPVLQVILRNRRQL